jgi:enoyl-CoA hydratase
MPPYRTVLYEVADGIARITLNRPQQRNAQSTELLHELDHAILAAGADPAARVILLTGAGDHFSAGHDLGTADEQAYRAANPIDPGIRGFYDRTWQLYVDMHLRWRNVPTPMIAAVQGYCIFGGWMVASTADVLFAADDAMFLGSLFQYFSIPWDLHPRRAKEILFQGRFVDAAQARELGLVNRVIPRADLLQAALAYAADVAANDPQQMRMVKRAVNAAQDTMGFTAAVTGAHSHYMLTWATEQDPGFTLAVPGGKRRPMVQVALERYRRDKARIAPATAPGPDDTRQGAEGPA